MNEEETCPACSAQIRYSITRDEYICTGCGCAYSWPMRPPEQPAEAEPNPEQDPQ